MEHMKNEVNEHGQGIGDVVDLIEAYRDLLVIKAVEHSSQAISVGIMGTFSTVLIIFVLLFAGLGTAWWLGEYLGDMKAGFFLTSAACLFLFIILLLMAHKILIPKLRNLIIKKIYEKD